jgi:hypothetical protein
LTCFTWDAEEFPKEKVKRVTAVLRDMRLKGDKRNDVARKLYAAEKVYRVLKKNSDDEFWSRFYRVAGYHLGEAGQRAQANEARRKALKITVRMQGRKANSGIRKELLLISGAMRYHLHEEAGALKDFNNALTLHYRNDKLSKRQNLDEDTYLTDLLTEYIEKIQSDHRSDDGKVPALSR